MATTTMTEVRLRRNDSRDGVNNTIDVKNADCNRAYNNTEESSRNNLEFTAESSHQNSKSFSCFITASKESPRFWQTPVKYFHVAARELSVLLILIETLILLGGYLVILGVHHSIKYCLSKLRHKAFAEDHVSYMPVRNYQNNARPVVPRRVPRGRMAGG